MKRRVLITGSRGLVGTKLVGALAAAGWETVMMDLRGAGAERGDVRDRWRVAAAVDGCEGIVHLAAMSRVAWTERDPAGCDATNVGGVKNVVDAAAAQGRPPWLVFASSREVYGEPRPGDAPVGEDAPLRPINVYGRAKVVGEEIVVAARARGVRSAVVRLSNVYGGLDDHHDRVVPAFVRAALTGAVLRVEGAERGFDFTHIDDVTRGLTMIVRMLSAGVAFVPTVHLVTGRATTLGELSRMAVVAAGARVGARVVETAGRSYDVTGFVGDPARAAAVLDWRATVGIAEGVQRYTDAMRARIEEER